MVIGLLVLLQLVLAAAALHVSDSDETIELRIDDHTVLQGRSLASGVSVFNVGFAEPPVGNLRWQAPQLLHLDELSRLHPRYNEHDTQHADANTVHVLNGVESHAACMFSEDCLYMTVWVPTHKVKELQSTMNFNVTLLPVYFYIFGGAFQAEGYQTGEYWIAQSPTQIVVLAQYRLGVFGWMSSSFLDAEQGSTSGNYGLLDQQGAMRWMHTNIATFGGDANRITIGGQSAGSMSVCYHLAAPSSSGLFHAAIMQSGGCDQFIRDRADANRVAHSFAAHVDCTGNDAAVLACLRALSSSRINSAMTNFSYSPIYTEMQFFPIINDGKFITVPPSQAFRTNKFNKVPLIAGATLNESGLFFAALFPWASYTTWSNFTEAFQWFVNENITLSSDVLQYYSKDNPQWNGKATDALMDATSTFLFQCSNHRAASYMSASESSSSYMYSFDYVCPRSLYRSYGAVHASDMPFTFFDSHNLFSQASTYTGGYFTSAEEIMSKTMMQFWLRFIVSEHHDPNDAHALTIDGALQNVTWPLFSPDKDVYLEMSPSASLLPAQGFHVDACKQWANFLH